MAKSDLFTTLDALWSKQPLESPVSFWIVHRFLSWDRDLAPAARELSRGIKDDKMLLRTWQGLLPKGPGAPRLGYPAAKKRPAEDELTARVMKVEKIRRERAEELIQFHQELGDLDLYAHYGVEPPKGDEPF